MKKKRIRVFLITLVAIISLLLTIRFIYILLNEQKIKETALDYKHNSVSYYLVGEEIYKKSNYLNEENLDTFVAEYEQERREVAIENDIFKEDVEIYKDILSDYISGESLYRCDNISFKIKDVKFNLDCSEVTVTIEDDYKAIHSEKSVRNFKPYYFINNSTDELKIIKEDGKWKVRTSEMVTWSTDVKKIKENDKK